MPGAKAIRHRILIGAGSYADAKAALKLAQNLVESLSAEFGGVLFEETLVADLATRPGQRVVTYGGSVTPAPSAARLRAMIDHDIKAFREALRRFATLHRRAWSFEHRQGDMIAGICAAADGWDILLLGNVPQPVSQARVVLVAPSNGTAEDARGVARKLAQDLKADFVTVAVQEPATAHGGALTWADESGLLKWLSRASASAIVLDATAGPFRSQTQLRRLVDAARCPVLVLGAQGMIPETTDAKAPQPQASEGSKE